MYCEQSYIDCLGGPLVPELPDITVYVEAIAARVVGRQVLAIRTNGPFVLRTVAPSPSELAGREVKAVSRLGKRIVLELDSERFVSIHLMVSGRLHWKPTGARLAGKAAVAAFDFEHGSLILTEAASRKRAAIHLFDHRESLAELDRGGLEPLTSTLEQFTEALRRENHTLKRTLTDPRLFSGIGNSYSDEILHAAQLSPIRWTSRLTDAECARLFDATQSLIQTWTERLRAECGNGFPSKVTAFRPDMAVHGKYGQPCPRCGAEVQHIVYAENECNYCPTCQTHGKLLADRGLSRLLKGDWPKTVAELEERKAAMRDTVSIHIDTN